MPRRGDLRGSERPRPVEGLHAHERRPLRRPQGFRRWPHHRERRRQGRAGVQEEVTPIRDQAQGLQPLGFPNLSMSNVGVLLVQLGTPDAPTAQALRPYLRQFLGDPRVIEVPRWKWFFILNLFILPFRPKQSAAKYRRIWSPETGSPLLHWTKTQTAALQQLLPDVPVRLGMQVGN